MLLHSIIKYLILDQCIETLFDRVYFNFQTPDDKVIKVMREIYFIYSNVKLNQGINIGTFEQFYEDQIRVFGNCGDNMYRMLIIQLDFMKNKYPEYVM